MNFCEIETEIEKIISYNQLYNTKKDVLFNIFKEIFENTNEYSNIHKRFNLLHTKTITEKDLILIEDDLIDILKTIFNINNMKIKKYRIKHQLFRTAYYGNIIVIYQLFKIIYYNEVSNQYFIYNLKYYILNHSSSKNYLKIQIEEGERKDLDFKTVLVETGINIETTNLIIDQKLLEMI